MQGTNLPNSFQLRAYGVEDIPALAALHNRTFADEPTTVAQHEHWERTYPEGNPRERKVAELSNGQIVGYGECQYPFWTTEPDFYNLFVIVDPDWQHRGIGQALLRSVAPYAQAQGVAKLRTHCREDFSDAIHFLEQAGFAQIGIRFESALDVQAFEETPFAPTRQRALDAGYAVVTLAEARRENPEEDRQLYEVFAATVVDVPFPGDERAKPEYETFRAMVLDAPNTPADGIFIARHGDEMAGMTTLELLPNGVAFTGMTGVLAAHRGRGVATLVKLASLRYLKDQGFTEARTHNDTANPAILALNEKLGYRRRPGWLAWEKSA